MCATIEEVIWAVLVVCFIIFVFSLFFTHPEDN